MAITIYRLISFLLPERLIRVLFISSLYTKIFKIETVDPLVLHKLNSILKVCENDYALGAGMKLSNIFWNDVELKQIQVVLNNKNELTISKEVEEEIASAIIKNTPKWLLYNRADMYMDIRRMVEYRLDLPKLAY